MIQKPLYKTKQQKPKTRKAPKNTVSAFIAKTYEILEDCKYPDIVDWNFEGTAIVIKNPIDFAQTVLNIYFKHKNLTSFVRQLNMYNFHKQRTPKIEHVYYHELFQREKKYLLSEIKRKNQEQSLSDSQEKNEDPEPVDMNLDISTIIQEKQVLKRFNNQAVGKISCLEGKIKELTVQNQTLKDQIWQQDERDKILISLMANILKKYGIPPTELSLMMTPEMKDKSFPGQLEIDGSNMSPQCSNMAEKSTGTSDETDISTFLNLEECHVEPIITAPQILNNKINFREVSPSSFIGKAEVDLHWGAVSVAQPYFSKPEVPKSYIPQYSHFNEKEVKYNKINPGVIMRLPGQGEMNLGKRRFEEGKAGSFGEHESFDVIMKKIELGSSVRKDAGNLWNNELIGNMWIKNKECGEDFSTDYFTYKQAY